MTPRRFPPPWTVDDNGACFIVKAHTGQALAYVYYEEEPERRSAAKLLTRDEASAWSSTSQHLYDPLTKSGEIETMQKGVGRAGTDVAAEGSLLDYVFPRFAQQEARLDALSRWASRSLPKGPEGSC